MGGAGGAGGDAPPGQDRGAVLADGQALLRAVLGVVAVVVVAVVMVVVVAVLVVAVLVVVVVVLVLTSVLLLRVSAEVFFKKKNCEISAYNKTRYESCLVFTPSSCGMRRS